MKLAVGFLTYNEASAKYLAEFLPSLETALKFLSVTDYQVYAFDNSSPDNKLNYLGLENYNQGVNYPQLPRRPIKYLSAGSNLGFSQAYNILINLAVSNRTEYFLIINPDTLLEPKAIEELLKVLEGEADLATVAPKVLRWDFDHNLKTKIIDSLGLILRPALQFLDLGQGEEDDASFYSTEIIGPSGAAGLFRISALQKIAELGGNDQIAHYFDERFFMYKEDCDLAYRLFLAGFKSRLVITAIIYHDRTATSSGSGLWNKIINRRKKSRQIRSWSFKNQHIIFNKYWKKQNNVNQFLILFRLLSMFIFSLILEQFNLKQYYNIWQSSKIPSKQLTNIK